MFVLLVSVLLMYLLFYKGLLKVGVLCFDEEILDYAVDLHNLKYYLFLIKTLKRFK